MVTTMMMMTMMTIVSLTLHSWSSYSCQELVSLALNLGDVIIFHILVIGGIINNMHAILFDIIIYHPWQPKMRAVPALELDSGAGSSLFGMGTEAPAELEFENSNELEFENSNELEFGI